MVRRVTDPVNNEAKLLAADAEWMKQEKEAILEYLEQKFQTNDKWKSGHTNKVMDVVYEGEARRKHPGNPSL